MPDEAIHSEFPAAGTADSAVETPVASSSRSQEAGLRHWAILAATGDVDAAETLFRNLHAPLVSFLYMMGLDRQDIDDVAQEVAIQMYGSLDRYVPDQPFLPWLRGIARNVVNNRRRSEKRRRLHLQEFRHRLHAWMEQVPSPEPDWDLEGLRRCLAKLTGHSRMLVQQYYIQGMSCVELGEQLSANPAAVRKALSRIRQGLRECLNLSIEDGTVEGRA